jgi:hypothetical protein
VLVCRYEETCVSVSFYGQASGFIVTSQSLLSIGMKVIDRKRVTTEDGEKGVRSEESRRN